MEQTRAIAAADAKDNSVTTRAQASTGLKASQIERWLANLPDATFDSGHRINHVCLGSGRDTHPGDVPSVVEFDGSSGSWHSYAASSVASSFETSVRNARLSRGR